ncbi:MoaD/ThiS family protein [Anaerovorax odorimutans]|uniref:MoaD/ThiS family protein n=1 Tax=Anaerovorax odorimutans TaxID=109327 RepID=UPI000408A458|nr:MoaD/ThiS family protein [Anaerovorax odorimutans]
MKITITLRGSLLKYFNGDKERVVEVPDSCTCEEALATVGINWREIKSFGFVAINGKRVMIFDQLKEGDELKAYPRISGG